MFNLDQAIVEWRGRMLAAGIKEPSSLDELENHLREHVEQLMRKGTSAQEAFHAAAQRIGQIDLLKREFEKAEGFLGWLDTVMKTRRTPGLVAIVVFVISHCLPAYGSESGFACLGYCWQMLLGRDIEQ